MIILSLFVRKSGNTGFFKCIRNKMSIITSIKIYNTIIKPHFEFGSTILYSCRSDQQIIRLQKLQNKADKIDARYFEMIECKRKTTS